jgi:DNA-binding response OmpR family regulator
MAPGAATGRDVRLPSRLTVGSTGRILVIHPQGAQTKGDDIVTRLREEAYDVIRLGMKRSLVNDVLDDDPDVVVVEYVLGSFDLVRLCHDLRAAIDGRIIIVASGSTSVSDAEDAFIVDVLDAGADDFLSSETSAPIMAARLRVAMRARPKRERLPRRITVGDVGIDAEAHIVRLGGEIVKCPPLQFELLVILARHAGLVVSRDSLFRELWGVSPSAVDPRRLRIAISVLRGVLGVGPHRPVIESVPRSGYRLSVPPP